MEGWFRQVTLRVAQINSYLLAGILPSLLLILNKQLTFHEAAIEQCGLVKSNLKDVQHPTNINQQLSLSTTPNK